jgi:hypothetical protein
MEGTMKTSTRIFAPLFALVILTGGSAWLASARADAASAASAAVESDAYEYDYLPWQLVDPTGEYAEHIETF